MGCVRVALMSRYIGMKVIIEQNKRADMPKNTSRLTRAEQFMSELVYRQRAIEAEFRDFSASMVRSKTMEVIS
jgi:hypothetical protein